MRRNFNDSNKQFIIVIIFIAFISISIYFLATSGSDVKSDNKKKSNDKSQISNTLVSNSNVTNSNTSNKSNNNIKGSKPVKIVTSNKGKTSNATSNKNPNTTISYFTTDVSTNKVYVGNKASIKVTIVPSTVKTKITYTSENPYVAQVSSEGIITGISPGVCNIKINVEGGGTSSF